MSGVLFDIGQPASLPRFPFRGKELEGCVLYAPLWDEQSKVSPFRSLDPIHHLLTVTTAVWTPPTGYVFDGDDKITTPLSINGFTGITVSAWVNPGDLVFGETASKMIFDDGAADSSLYIDKNTYRPFCYIKAGALVGSSSTTVLSQGTWYLLTGTYDGTTVRIYVNGVVGSVTGATTGAIVTATNSIIGWGQSDRYWKGVIGEALVYNRALTAGEIMRIYESTKWRYQS